MTVGAHMTGGQPAWKAYEAAAVSILRELLAELGLSEIEPKQMAAGLQSDTKWEIDAKGFSARDGGTVVIEIRRRRAKGLTQEEVAAVAWRIHDTGAVSGILISPLPLQRGAKLVAASAGIVHVQLSAGSNATEFIARFLNKVCVGLTPDGIAPRIAFLSATLERVESDETDNPRRD